MTGTMLLRTCAMYSNSPYVKHAARASFACEVVSMIIILVFAFSRLEGNPFPSAQFPHSHEHTQQVTRYTQDISFVHHITYHHSFMHSGYPSLHWIVYTSFSPFGSLSNIMAMVSVLLVPFGERLYEIVFHISQCKPFMCWSLVGTLIYTLQNAANVCGERGDLDCPPSKSSSKVFLALPPLIIIIG